MANELSTRQKIFAVAQEGTYGVDKIDADFVANNDLRVLDVGAAASILPIGDRVQIDLARNSVAVAEVEHFHSHAEVKIPFSLKGWRGGTAGLEAPLYAPLLAASNHSETIVATTSATYKQVTNWGPSFTAYMWQKVLGTSSLHHRLYKATGVRGIIEYLEFGLRRDAFGMFDGRGIGYEPVTAPAAYWSAAGVPLLRHGGASVTYTGDILQDTSPFLMSRSLTITIDGEVFDCKLARLRPNLTPVNGEDNSGAATVSEVWVTGGDTPAQLELETKGDGGDYAKLLALLAGGSKVAASMTFASGGARITVSAPKATLAQDISKTDQNGVEGHGAVLDLLGDYSSNVIGENAYTVQYHAAA